MPILNLKPTDNRIKTYYAEIDQLASLGVTKETSVRAPFQTCSNSADGNLTSPPSLNTL